jgi:hypothetical protein
MCRVSVMESVMDSLMVPCHADHRAVPHGYAVVMERSLAPLCLMEAESV